MQAEANVAPERAPVPPREHFYETYGGRGRPVLFINAMRGWRAIERWSFEFFREEFGGLIVPVNSGRYERAEPGARSAFARPPARRGVAEYIDALGSPEGAGGDRGYLSGLSLLDYAPSLANDVAFPPYDSSPRLSRMALWLSAAGTVTQLHFDRAHNLFGQVVGRKRVQLYSPDRSAELFPVPVEGNASVSVSELELEYTPEAKRQRAASVIPDYDFELSPGELLFLPYGWWHRITTVTESISVNLWWWTKPMVLGRGPDLLKTTLALAWSQRGRRRRAG